MKGTFRAGQIVRVKRRLSAGVDGCEVVAAIVVTGKVVHRDPLGIGGPKEPLIFLDYPFEGRAWTRVADIR